MHIIDINCEQGNAFNILAQARSYGRQLAKEGIVEWQHVQDVLTEMRAGDYTHLVNTFNEYFCEELGIAKLVGLDEAGGEEGGQDIHNDFGDLQEEAERRHWDAVATHAERFSYD